jgi:hypothetical protein
MVPQKLAQESVEDEDAEGDGQPKRVDAVS